MKENKTGRIMCTCLSEMNSHLFERGSSYGEFKTIAHPPLGYGCEDCGDTEVDYFKSITFFVDAAKEEQSSLFVLGFAPCSITSYWIKAAELIIQGSQVKMVMIPMARIIDSQPNVPSVYGSIIYVDRSGICKIEDLGIIETPYFWKSIISGARVLNTKLTEGDVVTV